MSSPSRPVPDRRQSEGVRGQLRRTRLIERFDDDVRVTIVRAEGGAGKTILVTQWMRARPERRMAWITVDDGIVDGRSFWFRTFISLRAALPSAFHDLTSADASGLVDPRESVALLASVLLAVQEPIVLVFDDLHHVSDEVQDQLVSLVRQVPHLRIVVTTRRRTRFETLLLQASLDVRVIGSRELAFTAEEVAELAHDLPFDVDESDLAIVERVTRGHPLTTRLALFLMRVLTADGDSRPRSDAMARALATVANDFVPPFENDEEERLALAIALCPEVDEPLAVRLTDDEDAWSTVASFEERGLGRITMRRGRPVFLMHTLVISALRNEAERRLSAERIAAIRAIAFEQLADVADPIDTLTLLVDGGMDRAVFPHFARNFSELSIHRTREIIDILGRLPDERLARDGGMAIALGTAISEGSIIPSSRAARLAKLGMAGLAPADEHDPNGTALRAVARFAGLRVRRDYDAALIAADDMLRRIDALGAEQGDDPGWYPAKLQAVLTALLAHRIDRVFELSGLLDGDHHIGRLRHLNSILAFADAYGGDMPRMRGHLAAIGDVDRPGWRGSHYAVGWHLASVIGTANDGDVEGALELLVPLIENLSRMDMWPAAIWVRGMIQLVSGRVADGLADLDATLPSCRSFPIGERWSEQLLTLRAELLMASGDLAGAGRELARAGDDPASVLARARRELLSSRLREALVELDAPTSAAYLPAQSAQRSLLRAAVHARLGDTQLAASLADQGLAVLNRTGFRLPLSFIPSDDLEAVLALAAPGEHPRPVGSPFAAARVMVAPLTNRETVVLRGLATASSFEQIAASLHVSPNTIKSQARSVYRKLGVSSRAEAVRKATQAGVL